MKVGDRVSIISVASCCRAAGFLVGDVGKIIDIVEGSYIVLKSNGDRHDFNASQLKKYTNAIKIENIPVTVIDTIEPYKKYIVLSAGLFLLDYFFFKGKFSKKLQTLASKVFNKAYNKVNNFLEEL